MSTLRITATKPFGQLRVLQMRAALLGDCDRGSDLCEMFEGDAHLR